MTQKEMKGLDVATPTNAEFKQWRQGLGWTADECARMLQYKNSSAIYQIESGIRKVPKRVAVMMSLYDLTYIPANADTTTDTE